MISVILTYYKKKKFIKKCLESITNQTYRNFEIILVYDDDDKEDLKYIKKISNKISKLKIIVNKKNIGVAKSRNVALKNSNGKYIAFLDCDDYWKKNKLKEQIKIMINKKLLFTHTSYLIVDENERKLGKSEVKNTLSYDDLLKSCDIGLSTVIFHRKLLKIANFPIIKTKEDYALWLIFARNNINIAGINKYYSSWRQSKNSLSSSIILKFVNGFKVYYKYEKKNIFLSLLFTARLAIYYVNKKCMQIINLNK
tara:strand:- start:1548 stop:2309 length:762 start_codon:yes stop_codon:yes gene_type:complete